MSNYYNIYEEYGLKHYQLPKVFFTNQQYMKMSNDAKVAWSILRDRFNLSVKNEWFDESGNIYFIYTNKELKNILMVGNTKLSNIKKELEENNLLEQKRLGQGKPNKLYIKKPNVTKDDIYKIRKDEKAFSKTDEKHRKNNQTPWESNEVPKWDFKKSQNGISRNLKTGFQEVPKSDTNNTDINDTDINDTDINYSSSSSKDKKELNIIGNLMNKEEEEKIKKLFNNNIIYKILAEYLAEKGIEERTIIKTIYECNKRSINTFSKSNVEKQFNFMMKKIEYGEQIYDFAVFFANGLQRLIELSHSNNLYQQEKTKKYELMLEQKEENELLYFNWLEEKS